MLDVVVGHAKARELVHQKAQAPLQVELVQHAALEMQELHALEVLHRGLDHLQGIEGEPALPDLVNALPSAQLEGQIEAQGRTGIRRIARGHGQGIENRVVVALQGGVQEEAFEELLWVHVVADQAAQSGWELDAVALVKVHIA